MTQGLIAILELASDDTHKSEITIEQIVKAKEYIRTIPKKSGEMLLILVSMNLINAALKMKEYKSKEKEALIHYGMLKPKVSRLLNYILEKDHLKLNDDFYINATEKCAFIEVSGLQFSFHNITITNNLQAFIDSDNNKPKPWKGVRLQKIAAELFEYTANKKEA